MIARGIINSILKALGKYILIKLFIYLFCLFYLFVTNYYSCIPEEMFVGCTDYEIINIFSRTTGINIIMKDGLSYHHQCFITNVSQGMIKCDIVCNIRNTAKIISCSFHIYGISKLKLFL